MAIWPNDADGDVFRGMAKHDFDFSQPYPIDFNVDFQAWPPSPDALETLEREYGALDIHAPNEEFEGYVLFQVHGHVTYELVVATQERASALMAPFGGICESWGVLQPAP